MLPDLPTYSHLKCTCLPTSVAVPSFSHSFFLSFFHSIYIYLLWIFHQLLYRQPQSKGTAWQGSGREKGGCAGGA